MANLKIPVYHPPKFPHAGSGGGTKSSGSSSSSGGSKGGGSSSGGSHSSGSSSSGHSSGGGGRGNSGGGGKKGGGGHKKDDDKKKGGAGKKGGGNGNPYGGSSYEAKAAHKNYDQAKAMQGQVNALKYALNHGFRNALAQRLRNINLVVGQQDQVLKDGYAARLSSLEESNTANEKAMGDASQQNVMNRTRERSNAVSEALNMGAGESDVLRSSMMSLRSWESNQGEINRSYFDSLHGLNSSRSDLVQDTKTARVNMASQANADRDQVYGQYYDQRSETYTNLGNAYGMMGEYYGTAIESKGSKKVGSLRNAAVKNSDKAFMNSAKAAGTTYKNPGAPKGLLEWEGSGDFESTNNASKIQDAATPPKMAKPQGATLRKWVV